MVLLQKRCITAYYFAPDVEQRLMVRLDHSSGWHVAVVHRLFAVYFNVLSKPSQTHGSLAGSRLQVYVYGSLLSSCRAESTGHLALGSE